MPDFELCSHGSIVTLAPVTNAGQDWADEYLSDAASLGGAICIEPRYVQAILDGLEDDGLTWQ